MIVTSVFTIFHLFSEETRSASLPHSLCHPLSPCTPSTAMLSLLVLHLLPCSHSLYSIYCHALSPCTPSTATLSSIYSILLIFAVSYTILSPFLLYLNHTSVLVFIGTHVRTSSSDCGNRSSEIQDGRVIYLFFEKIRSVKSLKVYKLRDKIHVRYS
jgi:hypothetical protein